MAQAEAALERSRGSRSHDDRETWPAWQHAASEAWLAKRPDDAWLRRPSAGHRPTVDEIVRRGERMRSATSGVWPTWQIDPDSPQRTDVQAQVGFFHEQFSGLYGPIDEAIKAVRAGGSPADLETLVRFLEADIYCFRSGYVTADVIDAIRRVPLPAPIAGRLRQVVLVAVDGRDRREFRAFCRLAVSVADEQLRSELERRAAVPVVRVTRHAQWVLDALAAGGR